MIHHNKRIHPSRFTTMTILTPYDMKQMRSSFYTYIRKYLSYMNLPMHCFYFLLVKNDDLIMTLCNVFSSKPKLREIFKKPYSSEFVVLVT